MTLLRYALPLAIPVAFVTATFAESQAPVDALWRPMVVALAVSVVVTALVRAVIRTAHLAQLTAGALLAVLVGAQLLALALVGVTTAQMVLSGRPGSAFSQMRGSFVATLGLAALIFMVFAVAGAIASVLPTGDPGPDSTGPDVLPAPDGPSMYLVLMDGYPRADVLLDRFGFDNSAFLSDLESREFDVAEASRSNYTATQLTLATMFHMRYADEISGLVPGPSDPPDQYRLLTRRINDGVALDVLKTAGYRIVTSVSAVSDASLFAADVVRDSGQITLFEEQLLRLSLGARIVHSLAPDVLANQQRQRVHSNFQHLKETAASESDDPTFMLAHVMLPHTPHLFAATGASVRLPECYPVRCQMWESRAELLGLDEEAFTSSMTEQIAYTNQLVIASVDAIIEADPDAVIIVFSDHGTRYRDDVPEEHFSNFFAARTPGFSGLFPEDVSPVNILGRLFEAYLGRPYVAVEYQAHLTEWPILNTRAFKSAQ